MQYMNTQAMTIVGIFKVSVDPNQSEKINNVEKNSAVRCCSAKKSRSIFT